MRHAVTKEDLAEAKRMLAELMAESGIRIYRITTSSREQAHQPVASEVHCTLRPSWVLGGCVRTGANRNPALIDKEVTSFGMSSSCFLCWLVMLDPALQAQGNPESFASRYKDIIGKVLLTRCRAACAQTA
jgi:hypothetical protein